MFGWMYWNAASCCSMSDWRAMAASTFTGNSLSSHKHCLVSSTAVPRLLISLNFVFTKCCRAQHACNQTLLYKKSSEKKLHSHTIIQLLNCFFNSLSYPYWQKLQCGRFFTGECRDLTHARDKFYHLLLYPESRHYRQHYLRWFDQVNHHIIHWK